MKVLTALLFVGLAAAVPTGVKLATRFSIYGAPIQNGVRADEIPMDGLRIAEREGWHSVYDKPFIMAVKKDDKPELATFLIKSGLSGLAHSPETRPLHDLLSSGPEKAGVLLSGAKFLAAPEIDLPISSLVLPKDFTLARLARLQAEHSANFPTLFVAPKEGLKAGGLEKLSLVGDFTVSENSIKVHGPTQE